MKKTISLIAVGTLALVGCGGKKEDKAGGTAEGGSAAKGTEITKSRPKSLRALPEMVFATSPTRSRMVSWLKSLSCIFMSSTVSIAFGAVKYTTPSRFPVMVIMPVYS